MDSNERVALTKGLIDHVMGKIPGPAYKNVDITVTWKTIDSGDENDYEIVPYVHMKWDKGDI